ncbi:MAG: hypothetical protein OEY14_06215, partial [Myxococcales bacterium]|nr:hypothetical protein [Myxococcales bacterium]
EAGAEAGAETVVWIEPLVEAQPAFRQTDTLMVSYQGKGLPREVAEALSAAPLQSPEPLRFDALERVIREDAQSVAIEPPAGSPRDLSPEARIERRLRGPTGALADPDSYADFIARHDVLCQKVISMWLFNPCSLILHGDSECFGPPNFGIDMVMTINAPWDNRVRDRGQPLSAALRHASPRPEELPIHVTDVRERDIIAGSRDKERAIFDHVFEQAPGMVVFFHGCVGVVAGSDVEEVYQEHKAKHRLPVLYFRGGDNNHLHDFYREVLVDIRKRTPHPADAPPNRVNLVGYSSLLTEPLLEALRALGVEVNGVLLPGVQLPAVQAFERAGLNVFLPNADFVSYYDQVELDSLVPRQLIPSPPFGFEGTDRFLFEIAEAAGLLEGLEQKLDALRAPHQERWRELQERARAQTLTVIGRDFEAARLLDPAYSYGIPLLPTLLDMGFSIDVLLLRTDPEIASWAEGVFADAGLSTRIEPRVFDSFEHMAELLEASPSRAVFSGFFFDWRATGSGKSIFSLQHFEPGYDGAVRSLERLLEVCETSFYRRYGRYLRRDRFGRRDRAFLGHLAPAGGMR